MTERLTYRGAGDLLGVPTRCLLKYVRAKLLPAPVGVPRAWLREDVLALQRWFEAQRVGDPSVPRPHHP